MNKVLLDTLPSANYVADTNGQSNTQDTGNTSAAAQAPQNVQRTANIAPSDAIGAVAGAAAAAPATGGVTQGGPNLPDVGGVKAPLSQVNMAIGSYVAEPSAATGASSGSVSQSAAAGGDAGGIGYSGAEASISPAALYTILQSVIASAQKLAAMSKISAGQASVNAKQQAVTDTIDKLQADRHDAGFQLGASVLGAGLGMGMALQGAAMSNAGRDALGSMLTAGANTANNLVSQAYSAISINGGFQLQSRQAEIRQKDDDVVAQINQNTQDASKSYYDQTMEFFRNLSQTFLTITQNHKAANDQTAQR